MWYEILILKLCERKAYWKGCYPMLRCYSNELSNWAPAVPTSDYRYWLAVPLIVLIHIAFFEYIQLNIWSRTSSWALTVHTVDRTVLGFLPGKINGLFIRAVLSFYSHPYFVKWCLSWQRSLPRKYTQVCQSAKSLFCPNL